MLELLESQTLEVGAKPLIDFSRQSIGFVIQNSNRENHLSYRKLLWALFLEVYGFEFRETTTWIRFFDLFKSADFNSDPRKLYCCHQRPGYSASQKIKPCTSGIVGLLRFRGNDPNGQLPEIDFGKLSGGLSRDAKTNQSRLFDELAQRFLLKDKTNQALKANLEFGMAFDERFLEP